MGRKGPMWLKYPNLTLEGKAQVDYLMDRLAQRDEERARAVALEGKAGWENADETR